GRRRRHRHPRPVAAGVEGQAAGGLRGAGRGRRRARGQNRQGGGEGRRGRRQGRCGPDLDAEGHEREHQLGLMTWNDSPPRGGPMVKVKGFPGPLYPADNPKGPSPDSDFVVALKRTLGRIGAWPWDPDGWDDSYSNRFAHGDGWGDETHAGI